MTAITEYRALTEAERRALAALKFDLAPTPDDVWRPSPFNVPDLHRDVPVAEVVGRLCEVLRTFRFYVEDLFY